MSLEKRRACIEFLSKKDVRITTTFKQSVFNLEKYFRAIDLITLKRINNETNFYVEFHYDSDQDSYSGRVMAYSSKGTMDTLREFDYRENFLDIRAVVWVND